MRLGRADELDKGTGLAVDGVTEFREENEPVFARGAVSGVA